MVNNKDVKIKIFLVIEKNMMIFMDKNLENIFFFRMGFEKDFFKKKFFKSKSGIIY